MTQVRLGKYNANMPKAVKRIKHKVKALIQSSFDVEYNFLTFQSLISV